MTAEPTRERVEAYEKALGCGQRENLATGGLCDYCRLSDHEGYWTDLGCPAAVAAARVEAERVDGLDAELNEARNEAARWHAERDSLRAVVEQVRALHYLKPIRAYDTRPQLDWCACLADWPCSTVLALLPEATS